MFVVVFVFCFCFFFSRIKAVLGIEFKSRFMRIINKKILMILKDMFKKEVINRINYIIWKKTIIIIKNTKDYVFKEN